MKIALVHDYLGEFGGAERVLLALSEMWPDAPIYTAFYRKGSSAWERFKDKDIRVSWAHHVPAFGTKLHSPLRFLAPFIWSSFDFSHYDVVIGSSSWYITKGFVKKSKNLGRSRTIEICYCHTPPRWLYGYRTSRQNFFAKVYGTVVGFFMRHYDFEAAQRVDYFIANSQETARRIKKFYRRDSVVIYPPIDLSPITYHLSRRNYFLVVSRLAQPKNIEIAIAAANRLGLQLKIAGTGPDEARLRLLAGPTVTFLGFVADADLPELYAGAKAFLALSPDEDFGMTPVEAMAAGTPVIALDAGGYRESVIAGNPPASSGQGTGIFFDEPTAESLIVALKKFAGMKKNWVPACQKQAQKFKKEGFQKEIRAFVTKKVSA